MVFNNKKDYILKFLSEQIVLQKLILMFKNNYICLKNLKLFLKYVKIT